MALRGHVFNKQLFSSECFALFIDIFLGKNSGVIRGCELLNTSNNITLEKGFFCVKGRFLEEQGYSIFEIEPVEQDTMFCKLVCEIDLSQVNTTSELKQAYYKIIKSTTDYPTLKQEDITVEGSTYQFEFAQFKVTTNGIEDFQDKRTFLDFESFYSEIRGNAQTVFDEITAQKNTFFAELNITTKAEADALITDLQQYCDSVKEVLDGNVAINLLNRINTKADTPIYYTLTLLITGWVLNETTQKYEYTVEDESITENDYISVDLLDKEQEEILRTIDGNSYNGGYKFTNEELPETDISLQLVIIRTKPKVTSGPEQEESNEM